jgi:hypothetical protein
MISKLLRMLATGLFIPLGVHGAPTELFFSEYVEGTSNNKALEIFNGTGSAIDLALGGYNVQMFFNGSGSAGLTIALSGVVAHGDVFVLAQAAAVAAILAQADQTSSFGWYNGDDAIVLSKGAVVVDVIGQVGFDPGTEWGSGLASTADNTLRRIATVEAGDAAGSDAFAPAQEWIGFATDTFDGLGSHALAASPVPEPAALALVLLALGGMMLARYRSSTSASGASSAMAISFSMRVPQLGQQNWRNCGVGSMKRRGSPTIGLDAWIGRSPRAQRAL